MHVEAIPLALRAPAPQTRLDVDLRLGELRDELAEAMVLFATGRLAPDEYARRARRVKDERLGLEASRGRLA